MAFLLCPNCKTGDGNLSIRNVMLTLTVYKNGTDVEGQDHEYNDSNPADCTCGWEGTVGQLLDPEDDEVAS